MTRYEPVDPRADLPSMERRVLEFWRENDVFRKSLALREGAPEWVFYDGPPTANNRPHIGHVEARTFKDLYPRFKTMTGHYVHRKAGWDCHGLPVEVEVEKEIGTRSKRDIEAFGVSEFVQKCRQSVIRYVDDWKRMSERLGFWIDMEDAYWTMDSSYVQSVWWALKRLFEANLLHQDFKSVAYCPRCGTGLSDAEVALGYTHVVDPSVYVLFPVTRASHSGLAGSAALVGWTTTPWTLVSNLGLAVAEDQPYALVEAGGRNLIVAEARLDDIRRVLAAADVAGNVKELDHFPGSELVGALYSPPFENVADDNAHRVVAAGFVVMNEGTGIVHIAPGFGADDLELGRREGWPVFRPVDDSGRFTEEAPDPLRGRPVKESDPDITEDLRRRGILLYAEEYPHTYPLCWRCDTPLLYMARTSWYVRTTAYKTQMLDANQKTNWFPAHIRDGRFGNWLENNVDWALSRERYWGTPLPIWRCPDGHHTPVGSLAELSDLAGRDVTQIDPHRPAIDEIAFACPVCGAEARRLPEVIDAWFDSGAMPYAQWGYMGPDSPAADVFRRRYPADFIAEGLDQTRGWFYSLMAEGVMLQNESAYRNVICHGLVTDKDGRKMSKRLGNVIEPDDIFDRFGADAVRWYMVASGSPWSLRRLSNEAIEEVVRHFLLTLWNTYSFFVTYANIDDPDMATAFPPHQRSPIDRWALSRLHSTLKTARSTLDAFDATGAAKEIAALVDDLSNWYVRRSRRRFWDPARGPGGSGEDSGGGGPDDKIAAYATLHQCLTNIATALAPFTPFIAEELHGNLVAGRDASAPESVHLADFPAFDPTLVDVELERAMNLVRAAVSLGRTVRSDAKMKVRQPLAGAVLHVPGDRSPVDPLLGLVAEELNVKRVRFAESSDELAGWRARPNFRSLGPRLGPRAQEVADVLSADDGAVAAALARGEEVTLALPSGSIQLLPDDAELVQQTRKGWGLASDGVVTVALDLELTEELRLEGLARELVRAVQDLRKSAGLEVTDRIVLGVSASGKAARAVDAFRDSIAGEVLAVEIVEGLVPSATGAGEVNLDGQPASLSLAKAEPGS